MGTGHAHLWRTISQLSLLLLLTSCLFRATPPGVTGRPCDARQRCGVGYVCQSGLCQATDIGTSCTVGAKDCGAGFCALVPGFGAYCTEVCATSASCAAGFRCQELPTDPGTMACLPELALGGDLVGDAMPGDTCNANSDCQSGLCNVGVCTDRCQNDLGCSYDPGVRCKMVGIGGKVETQCRPLGANSTGQQGDACNSASDCALGTCVDDGAGSSVCADPCCSSSDCPDGSVCWLLTWGGWTPDDGVVRLCIPFAVSAASKFGEACGQDADCSTGTCWTDPNTENRACTDLCCSNDDCPASYVCRPEAFDATGDGTEDVMIPVCVTRP